MIRLVPNIAYAALGLVAGAGTAVFGANLTISSFATYTGQTNIVLQATGNITFQSGTLALPPLSPGAPAGQLVVQAQGDVLIADGSSVSAGPGWSVSVLAGANFGAPGTANPGAGNITLQGSATLSSLDGAISFLAGNNVAVGSGFVHTTGGGPISVQALAGTVTTGTRASGLVYLLGSTPPYHVDPNLGGISTGAGGDVNITAGQDIVSYLPFGTVTSEGGSGAFGAAPSAVTLIAGRNVIGHYLVRNGTGTICAGQNAGTSGIPLALSLVAGGWAVSAAQDVVLQEVRNPNGVFNNLGPSTSATKHLFDYSPNASVSLSAGNTVTLGSSTPPRCAGEPPVPIIYPPTLEISAGPGGIVLAQNLTLFPSPKGQLQVSTSNGGALSNPGLPGSLVWLEMSDSAASQYNASADPPSFGSQDHAIVPVHLTDAAPAQVNVSGDMTGVMLVVPKRAAIQVGGSLVDSRCSIQNLSAADASSLSALADILNGTNYTTDGYVINGPGTFSVTARNLDLGGSAGIQSVGALNNPALAGLGAAGADLQVALSGNLSMVASAIGSLAGGTVDVRAQGSMDIGLAGLAGPGAGAPHGIFTSAKADVSVVAGGDIRLSGSRVAAYDGGDIQVASLQGSVDVSLPGNDAMAVTKVFGNPVFTSTTTVAGNGILASTLPDAKELVGDITVIAGSSQRLGCGAMAQVPLNGTSGASAHMTLRAGQVIAITNLTETCMSIIASGSLYAVAGMPPVFLTAAIHPSNVTTLAGGNAQFTATAGGLTPLSYQWFKNGVWLSGATGTTLSITNVQRADAGMYSVVVFNPAGALTNEANLHVLVPQVMQGTLGLGNRSLLVSFHDADGQHLTAEDIPTFSVEVSTNLVEWSTANLMLSTNVAGDLTFDLPLDQTAGRSFYRVSSY